ncbi:MAG: nucleotidyltransferase domain-containing protein [Pseudobdellovibrionaceae bacterium]
MRLNPKEISAITTSFRECLKGFSFKLYLFGSRIDDNKKGGDIDLLVVVGTEEKAKTVDLKSKIRLRIFDFIPEQKIDITVATESELSSDVFLKNILGSARLLL